MDKQNLCLRYPYEHVNVVSYLQYLRISFHNDRKRSRTDRVRHVFSHVSMLQFDSKMLRHIRELYNNTNGLMVHFPKKKFRLSNCSTVFNLRHCQVDHVHSHLDMIVIRIDFQEIVYTFQDIV